MAPLRGERARLRLHLVLLWAWQATYYPLSTLLLRDVYRLSALHVAYAGTAATLADALAGPAWGYAADRRRRHREMHALSIGAGALMRGLAVAVPWHVGLAYATPLACFLWAATQAASGGAVSLADAATLNVVERAGGVSDDYGRERLWGAVGWMFAAPLVGLLVDACGRRPGVVPSEHPGADTAVCAGVPWPFVAPAVGALLAVAAAITSYAWLPHGATKASSKAAAAGTKLRALEGGDDEQRRDDSDADSDADEADECRQLVPLHSNDGTGSNNVAEKTRAALSTPSMIATCLAVGLASAFMAAQDSFFFVYMDDVGGSTFLAGLAMFFTCVAEVPVFYVAKWLRRTFLPHTNSVFRLVFVCYSLRFAGYYALPLLPSPYCVLPIQLLHGITFGLYYSTATSAFREASPPGAEASMMGVLSGVGASGRVVGMVFGGLLYGVRSTAWVAALTGGASGRFMWALLSLLAAIAAIATPKPM